MLLMKLHSTTSADDSYFVVHFSTLKYHNFWQFATSISAYGLTRLQQLRTKMLIGMKMMIVADDGTTVDKITVAARASPATSRATFAKHAGKSSL